MSQREWVFKIDGIQHRLQLRHTWIGWREIWLDGERVHRSYLFNDGGSFHEFWLQSHLIEVYYLHQRDYFQLSPAGRWRPAVGAKGGGARPTCAAVAATH
jgi:hypothetical protein